MIIAGFTQYNQTWLGHLSGKLSIARTTHPYLYGWLTPFIFGWLKPFKRMLKPHEISW
jgi:hypothetical protein